MLGILITLILVTLVVIAVWITMNRYSALLVAVAAPMTLVGIALLYNHVWVWGFSLLTPGVLVLTCGWKQLSGSNPIISASNPTPAGSKPRQVGLLKILGKRTEIIVEGTMLLLDWIPGYEIIGISVFDIVLHEEKDPIKIPKLLCYADDKKMARIYVDAEVALAFIPDIEDDDCDCKTKGWRSGGKKLAEFDDAGGYSGVSTKLRTVTITQAQEVAKDQTREWIETNSGPVSIDLNTKLNGVACGRNPSAIVSGVGLGVKVTKTDFNAFSSEAVRIASDKIVTEDLERTSDAMDNETFNRQITDTIEAIRKDKAERLKADPNDADAKAIRIPSWNEVRDAIRDNRLIRDGMYRKIDGGRLVNFNDVGEGTGGGRGKGK